MYFTLKQVREALAGSTGAYVSDSTPERLNWDINQAIRGLSGLSGWECMRRTVRFLSAGPVFALPQGYAGIVRVCVNGRPASLRSQDFRFLQSGPGDLKRPPKGFVPVPICNVVDVDVSSVIVEPSHTFKLLAFTDGDVTGLKPPRLVVTAMKPDGRMVRIEKAVHSFEDFDDDYSTELDASTVLAKIEQVVVENATDYISLYAVAESDETVRYQIACYNPQIPVPKFRRYEISGIPPDTPVEVLAETRIDPVPLVNDTDVVPFESPIEPIEWMIRADWQMKSGEVTQAQNYRTQAMNWLKAHEVTDDTIQTQVVVNSVYAGSMGEISEEADNI